MANLVDVLNTIRANASTEYQTRIPEATRDNITEVGSPLSEYTALANEFLSKLINRIAMTIVQNRTATNPLSILKKGSVPLGTDIQEIFTNMAKAKSFDQTGAGLLNREIPDTKAIYHRLSRKDMYKITVSKPQLQLAFTSYAKLEELLNSITTSLYSGDNFDEFVLMKNLFSSAITDEKMKSFDIATPVDNATGLAFVKAVKTLSGYMTFPSIEYNSYLDNAPTGDTKAVTTWTPKENQILLLRTDVLSSIDVDVLAMAFNMSKVEFMGRVLEVDNFGSATRCLGVLCDESFPQVYDNFMEMGEFYNPEGLYWNFMLHHWQTYSVSLFANAVALMSPVPEEE